MSISLTFSPARPAQHPPQVRTKLSEEEKALHKRTAAQLRLMLEYMGVEVDKGCNDKGLLATEVLVCCMSRSRLRT